MFVKSNKIENILSITLILISILLLGGKILYSSKRFTKIIVDKKIVNVGVVNTDSLIFAQFNITNVGRNKLIIQRIDAGCTCTNIMIDDTILKKGDQTNLVVIYSPEIDGFFKKDIKIYGNIKPSPLLISIVGEVK